MKYFIITLVCIVVFLIVAYLVALHADCKADEDCREDYDESII